MSKIMQKLRRVFAIFFVSKRKFIITYHEDGKNWLHNFHITAKNKKEAIKLFNSYGIESKCDIDIVDIYVCQTLNQNKDLTSREENYLNALVAIYDYLKLVDNDIIDNDINISMLEVNEETLSEMLFRKLKAYDIDLNKELGWKHLKPKQR